MTKHFPVVAVVGEPNVGKSTLLNKIAGGKRAVTSGVAGTTRDRQYIDSAWNGVDFTLLDTAGITFNTGGQPSPHGELDARLNEQIEIALADADFLLFVVDGKQPINAVDRKALLKFRKIKKPVALVINKIDGIRAIDAAMVEFQSLGI